MVDRLARRLGLDPQALTNALDAEQLTLVESAPPQSKPSEAASNAAKEEVVKTAKAVDRNSLRNRLRARVGLPPE